jgi:predicted transcriptional regulator
MYHWLMGMKVQIDIEALYEQHERLLSIEEQVADILREASLTERGVAEQIQSLAEQMLEQIEDVLDSEASRAAMEDVRLQGAVPWDEVEAELGR